MASTLKNLCTAVLSDSASVAYTATSVNAQIHSLVLTNNHSSAVAVTIWLVPAGSPSNSNKLMASRSIGPGVSTSIREAVGQVVPNGGSLYAQAATASVVSMIAGGVEQSTS